MSSTTISFRLDAHYLEKLAALTRDGESTHARARRLLIDALDRAEEERVSEELSEMKSKLQLLGEHLAMGVEALLVTAGEYPKEKAHDWVNRNLRER